MIVVSEAGCQSSYSSALLPSFLHRFARFPVGVMVSQTVLAVKFLAAIGTIFANCFAASDTLM